MKGIFRPETINYLTNRFGETCPAAEVPVPELASLIDTALTVIVQRCYPENGMGVENAAIVTMTDPFRPEAQALLAGVLIEFELDDEVEPSPAFLEALEGLTALTPGRVAYVVFGGNTAEGVSTFNDRYAVGAFFHLDYAMHYGKRELEKHADRIGSLLY